MKYMKACRNAGTIPQKAKRATLETFRVSPKSEVKCFSCGKPGHMRKQCHLPRQTALSPDKGGAMKTKPPRALPKMSKGEIIG